MFTATDKTNKNNSTADDIREDARRVKDDLRNAADNVKEDLEDLALHAGRRARKIAVETEETFLTKVRENPVQSSLIALGAGFVLGLCFRR
jgi:ElaB/YqjD/DUF883 family membrane-anchored ribosome-binding protein